MTNQYKLTENQKQLLLNYFKSDDFFDEMESYLADVIYGTDLNDILEQHTNLHVYGAFRSGYKYPLVADVKTHIGWNDKDIDNPIEKVILEKFINTQYMWGDIAEHEFEYMADSYSDIGELICVGRSGGYWGFEKIDFKHYTDPWSREGYVSKESYELIPRTQYIVDVLCNDLEYYARDYLCISENDFYIDDDTELEELNFQQNCLGGSLLDAESVLDKLRFEVTDMFEVNKHLIERLDSFYTSCKSLVEYWENAENCITESIERCYEDFIFDELNLDLTIKCYTFKGCDYKLTMEGLGNDLVVSYDSIIGQVLLSDTKDIDTFRLKDDLLLRIKQLANENYIKLTKNVNLIKQLDSIVL